MKIRPSLFLLTAVLGAASCPLLAKNAETSTPKAAVAKAEASTKIQVGEFTFKTPATWKNLGPQGMVKGNLEYLQKEDSGLENIVAKFYHFGKGQGGSVDANLKRWMGQFRGKPAVEKEELKFGDRSVQLVLMKGTYLSGPPFGQKLPKEGWALLGAILPSEKGSVFIKITEAEKSVLAARDALKKLIESAFAQEKEGAKTEK